MTDRLSDCAFMRINTKLGMSPKSLFSRHVGKRAELRRHGAVYSNWHSVSDLLVQFVISSISAWLLTNVSRSVWVGGTQLTPNLMIICTATWPDVNRKSLFM